MLNDQTQNSMRSSSVKRRCVIVCQHRSCLRNQADAVFAALRQQQPAGVFVSASDCLGQCSSGPTVQVLPDQTWYCRVKPSDVAEIVASHLQGDRPVARLLHPRLHPQASQPSFNPATQSPDEHNECGV